MAEPAPRSPEAWVEKLNAELDARRVKIGRFNDYYQGDHPLPKAPDRVKVGFTRWLKQSRSNWMGLIIDTSVERLAVQGIRYGKDQAADAEAWRIWQANDLDTASEMVHLEAHVAGESYVMVEPNPDDPDTPLILPEHPSQMIVACSAARPSQRLAAFKKWLDDSGYFYATLILPDAVYKLQSVNKATTYTVGKVRWIPRDAEGDDAIMPNPFGVVNVVPFRNRARLVTGGKSELDGITDIQDRINETLFQRVIAGQFAAFRQRYGTGMDLEMDPATGLAKKPFEPGVTELWVSTNPDARFGDFEATDLTPYLKSVEADIQHLAAITHTPPHYLLGQMVNLAAEALKAAEAGLVSKVRRKQTHFGGSWESVFSLAFEAAGDDTRAAITDAEIIWANPEFRTEGQLVDALVKMATLGVPNEALWERWGASPPEIARWKAAGARDALAASMFTPPAPPVPPPVPPPAPDGVVEVG